MHYFIQIHHATGDTSVSAVIESFLEAHYDAASTELEATETDSISEAAARCLWKRAITAFVLDHQLNRRRRNEKGKRNETFNYKFSFIIYFFIG